MGAQRAALQLHRFPDGESLVRLAGEGRAKINLQLELHGRNALSADKTVEYRSVDELMAAIREVRRGLLQQAAETGLLPGAPRQIRVTTGKGF